ncbi:hypothetical protein [Thioalkalivibrio sp. ALMg13-2]|uniref:hypothetical protein n=1 Tax=Thioalkalivibrio sp. ALMg13-2 TaxID=1158167 RepID=UPI000381A34D|nr:hypothetical protein [Thioalkalivibrio sp. ALMg13-2]
MKSKMVLLLPAILGLLWVVPATAGDHVEAAEEYETDSETGLIKAPGFDTVKNNCTVCHSARLFTSRGYTRKIWLEQIRWMQDTQGLWEFSPEVEEEILDYLETFYPPS